MSGAVEGQQHVVGGVQVPSGPHLGREGGGRGEGGGGGEGGERWGACGQQAGLSLQRGRGGCGTWFELQVGNGKHSAQKRAGQGQAVVPSPPRASRRAPPRTSVTLPSLLPPKPPNRSDTFSIVRPKKPCWGRVWGQGCSTGCGSQSVSGAQRAAGKPGIARHPALQQAPLQKNKQQLAPLLPGMPVPSSPPGLRAPPAPPGPRCRRWCGGSPPPSRRPPAAAAPPAAARWWTGGRRGPCRRAGRTRCAAAPATQTSRLRPPPAAQSGGGSWPQTWPGSAAGAGGEAREGGVCVDVTRLAGCALWGQGERCLRQLP